MFQKMFFALSGIVIVIMSFLAYVGDGSSSSNSKLKSNEGKARVYFFHSATCPHCQDELKFVLQPLDREGKADVKAYEIGNSKNRNAWEKVAKLLNTNADVTPFTVIGDEFRKGYSKNGEAEAWINNRVEKLNQPGAAYSDKVGELLGFQPIDTGKLLNKDVVIPEVNTHKAEASSEVAGLDQAKKTPIVIFGNEIGSFDSTDMTLPVAVFFIALIDGFNPCAMWVLVFLISLLIDIKSRSRLILLGGVFIFISGAIYFLALAGWSYLFNWLSPFATWINLAIAVFALTFAYASLQDYLTKKDDECKLIDAKKRASLLKRMKSALREKSLIVAVLAVSSLAISVNIVELFCSLGLPAIYASLLDNANIPPNSLSAFAYHLFYTVIYMLDDIIVFSIAVITLNISGIVNKFAKPMKLVTGVIMLIIAYYLYSQVLTVWFN